MHILILNWRDPKNPKAGGAEKLNKQILTPFIKRGDAVTWYAMKVDGLPKKEVYEGMTIIRFGNAIVHFFVWPFLYWSGKLGKADLIIDSIHGTGYLSTIVSPGTKKVILVCEVAQNIWDEMYTFPINLIGRIWERVMFKLYRNDKFWTISKSTEEDLIKFGVSPKNISILPMGFDITTKNKIYKKYELPTAIFVGRLTEMKGVKDAIRAITEINNKSSVKWTLNIIGRGEVKYERKLKQLVVQLNMDKYIHFLGYVDEVRKFEEITKSWILLVPSSREGWGMIVPEANYVGTQAIGYNSPGLSESLAKYSKSNKIVRGNVSGIVEELNKIHNPLTIKGKIIPGWSDLYKFVQNNYKQLGGPNN